MTYEACFVVAGFVHELDVFADAGCSAFVDIVVFGCFCQRQFDLVVSLDLPSLLYVDFARYFVVRLQLFLSPHLTL